MPMLPRRGPPRPTIAVFSLLALLLVPGLAPATPLGALAPAGSVSVGPAPVVQLHATVSWNGRNISDASGVRSAFALTYSSSAVLAFHWSAPASAVPVPVSTARLELFFFGYGVGARDVSQAPSPTASNGTINLTWDGANALRWLAEGTYVATASILNAAGSTLWSENFYLRITAPYSVLALIPIVLLILGIFELAALLRSGYEPPAKPAAPARPSPDPDANEKGAPAAVEKEEEAKP
ncbi:MAG: hypothetical protein L3J93_01590 [Thermoplasmata archaeon]|nr:hypothetical protein [Thermoplasmata archaeon]